MIRVRCLQSLIGNSKNSPRYSTLATPKVQNESRDVKSAKSFSEIPRLSRFRMIVDFLPGGKYYKRGLNDLHRSLNSEHGNILIMPSMLGKPEMVFTYNDSDNETLLVNEGTWPNRHSFAILKYFRETMRPDVYGGEYGSVASENGERWYKVRTLVNQVMLPPKIVQQYVQPIDEISSDFIRFVQTRSDDSNDEILGRDFNLWSLESIGNVTLDKRLGLFDENSKDGRAKELIDCVRKFFVMSVDFELNPSIWRYYHTKAFKEYLEVNNKLLNNVLSYVEEAMSSLADSSADSQSREGILQKLLKVDKRVAVIMACDSLFAGIDTTTSGVIGVLYCLAKNPDKQEKLREEILRLHPGSKSEPIDAKNMLSMPYLRSCIKEGLRLYPPVSGTARMTAKDLVLSGYHIPAGTHVVTWPQLFYRQERLFPSANEFLPERWLKETTSATQPKVEKFHFLPFGHGVRACPGKRIANMEMEVLLINLLRKFKIEWYQGELQVNSVLVNIPVGDIRFKLVEL